MKPTLRRNGKHMLTVRPRFDLSRHDAAAILAIEDENAALMGEDTPFHSPAAALGAIRDHLSRYGRERLDWYSDHITDRDPDEALAAAEEILNRWGWPE